MSACTTCGACCSYFRVSFYWKEGEIENNSYPVPSNFTENYSPCGLSMKGTNSNRPQCSALKGEVGQVAICQIYHNRPSPCREFQESYHNGIHNPRCDEARAAHGLAPLQPKKSAAAKSKENPLFFPS